jgi:hypothetical protein
VGLSLVALVASAVSLVVRFRRSRGDERQQLKWFTYARPAAGHGRDPGRDAIIPARLRENGRLGVEESRALMGWLGGIVRTGLGERRKVSR